MEPASPLTREVRESFQPKVVQLYSDLFRLDEQDVDEDFEPSEGFWREFFLLKPAKQKFHDVLEPLTADDLLHIQRQTRNYMRRSIDEFTAGRNPQNENALENLTAFLAAVLAKRFTNPSTDVIEVLAGLENVDKTMTDLVNGLENIISKSATETIRRKAIDCAVAAVAGSYQTSLVAYFIHKDFFHGLMKYVQNTPEAAPATLSLLGLLANYNKFEAQNIYQNRMGDLVNEDIMAKLVDGFVNTCGDIRDAYVAVQDDTPAQWTIGSTLSYVGLRALTPEARKPPPPTEEEAKEFFSKLPSVNAVVFLATYSFVEANNVFASQLISTDKDNDLESPLAAFLSTTSYLCHHAFRSPRTQQYSLLSLFTIRILVDDPILAKRLSSAEHKIEARLARQRPPHLPYISTPRTPTSIILDTITDTLSHNLRKRMSIPLYSISLTILHHVLTQLSGTRTRLPHHWSYIWLSLISLLRFLTTYANDLRKSTRLADLKAQVCTPLTSILTFSLLRGDNFLPDPPSYDDLFYKLVEASTTLSKFNTTYEIHKLPPADKLRRSTEALMAIATHYQNLVGKAKKQHQSPRQIQEIIGEGHETFGEVVDNISVAGSQRGGVGGSEEFGHYEKWRESAWKVELKKIIRGVVEDGRVVCLQ
ncbi:hypothetical protein LTR70_000219 [Exophiala xenobiotica]|uniref:Armadillo-like helical domain-containing protein n=1 Tax=Lithohypha guttulata TaxID=1690604 RepID=A0ABR0K629_9EURO|nr:hypothetical protein LTR24_007072 [Lithohypha guttulata]KAK5330897.1 hypothetical protein LTR70_000219 [Exophiala xenobiotica]